MSENGDNGNNVRFTISLPSYLNASLESEAKDRALTKAALARMIFADRYANQRAEWELRKLDGVPATP